MEEMPFFAIGNEELERLPVVKVDDRIRCRQCNDIHVLKGGERIKDDGTREPSDLLLFYNCGKHEYLAAIDGKLLFGNELVIDGEVQS